MKQAYAGYLPLALGSFKSVGIIFNSRLNNNILLLKTNIQAGHGGVSGRYESLKEVAFEYAFVLQRLGLVET